MCIHISPRMQGATLIDVDVLGIQVVLLLRVVAVR